MISAYSYYRLISFNFSWCFLFIPTSCSFQRDSWIVKIYQVPSFSAHSFTKSQLSFIFLRSANHTLIFAPITSQIPILTVRIYCFFYNPLLEKDVGPNCLKRRVPGFLTHLSSWNEFFLYNTYYNIVYKNIKSWRPPSYMLCTLDIWFSWKWLSIVGV